MPRDKAALQKSKPQNKSWIPYIIAAVVILFLVAMLVWIFWPSSGDDIVDKMTDPATFVSEEDYGSSDCD